MKTARLWRWLAVICLLSFAALGWIGREIYLAKPPIPSQVISASGETLYSAAQIERGQEAWRAAGGQQLGSVWGHGSYVAPDWSADWLHREALALREIWAQRDYGNTFAKLNAEQQAALGARLKQELRTNTYDATRDTITVSKDRAQAIRQVAAHYTGLFGHDPTLDKLREQYAMTSESLTESSDREALSGFFFWTAWSAATNRPGETDISYTSNWPHEPLVDNMPTAGNGIWSMVSIIFLIAGIAGMIWFHSAHREDADPTVPKNDPLIDLKPTPSMRATQKFFYIVIGLILLQVAMGVITAHYAVEGTSFFGFPLADFLPYTSARTMHTQLAVFWIATAWLATGLYIAPALSGHEPKWQKLGVNVLFAALIFVAVGSLVTGWLATLQRAGVEFHFWLGNQGLEY
ncbi:MAG: cbb3-type cytochrome c oxidase subunit I, partial [Gammaproteobacteria bacterium]|nr:cbb3-type cytochrome c oxidase subunit I [Gammaproteobacteria bacterium]